MRPPNRGPEPMQQFEAHVVLYVEDESAARAARQVILKLGASERVGGVHLGFRFDALEPSGHYRSTPERTVDPGVLRMSQLPNIETYCKIGRGEHPTEKGDRW